MTTPRRALITGASAGIGTALAREFARHGHNLVLVARRQDRLNLLADELRGAGRDVVVIAQDLALERSAEGLVSKLESRSLAIDILVNNAGVSYGGEFATMARATISTLMQLNMTTLVDLTHRLLPDMQTRGWGRILNVASLSAFQPVPLLTLYAASKAFVLSFSEGLAEELRDSGVSVSALCPGFTATDMVTNATGGNTGLPEVPAFLLSDVTAVAREGYAACMTGEVVRVPGIANRMAALWSTTTPRWLVRMLSGVMARQLRQSD